MPGANERRGAGEGIGRKVICRTCRTGGRENYRIDRLDGLRPAGQTGHMNIVIQDCESKEFLAKEGKWTSTASEAERFLELQSACEFARGSVTKGFDVVICFPGTKAG